MKTLKNIIIANFALLILFFCTLPQTRISVPVSNKPEFVGKVKINSNVSIRLLILKHTFEEMANEDAKLAIDAANLGSSQGLRIKDIGEHNIDPSGKIAQMEWYRCEYPQSLKNFISEQMKVNAERGDTLIVFTIGHGASTGELDTLGQRKEIMEAIAVAAEENNQETLWWQLSCYASAHLPKIKQLNAKQRKLLSIVASSDEHTESPAYEEGPIMEKLFTSMAKQSREIDPDDNHIVTAQELSDFLNSVKSGRGQYVYADSPQEAIFGLRSDALLLPIVDRNNKKQDYPDDYIPLPR